MEVLCPSGEMKVGTEHNHCTLNTVLDIFRALSGLKTASSDRMHVTTQRTSQNETFKSAPVTPQSLYNNRSETEDPESETLNISVRSAFWNCLFIMMSIREVQIWKSTFHIPDVIRDESHP